MRAPTGRTQLFLTTLAVLLVAAAAACEAPSGPRVSGVCVGVTNVGGVGFVIDAVSMAQDRVYDQGEVVATVTRHRRCNDTPDPTAHAELSATNLGEAPFEAGDSNHLAVGTKLCAIQGADPLIRLMTCDRAPSDLLIITSVHDEPID